MSPVGVWLVGLFKCGRLVVYLREGVCMYRENKKIFFELSKLQFCLILKKLSRQKKTACGLRKVQRKD